MSTSFKEAKVLGRALKSTIVIMAELGSIATDVLSGQGVTSIEELEWYPAKLRRDIHEAVYRRYGDIALRSFGFNMADFYPQAMKSLNEEMPNYHALINQCGSDKKIHEALDLFIVKAADNYDQATSQSQFAPDIRYGFSALRLRAGIYEFTAVTQLAPHHAAFSQGIIESYITRFISCDWSYQLELLTDRTEFFSEYTKFVWRCEFSFKSERNSSSSELTSKFKLILKEELLRAVMHESNKALNLVMESIRYAGLLQRAQAPDIEQIRSHVTDIGVLLEQRDMIGGDLWWASPIDKEHGISFAVVDCTGHSVPGAMLSVLVIASLEKIYATNPGIDPSSALIALDSSIRKSLRQHDNAKAFGENDDGCDAGIIKIIPGKKNIEFSGAKISLYQLQKSSKVIHHHASRTSIGYRESTYEQPRLLQIPFSAEDRFVITSDGFIDQPGGPNRISFGYRRLIERLENCDDKTAPEIAEFLSQSLKRWQGEMERRDDVILFVIQP